MAGVAALVIGLSLLLTSGTGAWWHRKGDLGGEFREGCINAELDLLILGEECYYPGSDIKGEISFGGYEDFDWVLTPDPGNYPGIPCAFPVIIRVPVDNDSIEFSKCAVAYDHDGAVGSIDHPLGSVTWPNNTTTGLSDDSGASGIIYYERTGTASNPGDLFLDGLKDRFPIVGVDWETFTNPEPEIDSLSLSDVEMYSRPAPCHEWYQDDEGTLYLVMRPGCGTGVAGSNDTFDIYGYTCCPYEEDELDISEHVYDPDYPESYGFAPFSNGPMLPIRLNDDGRLTNDFMHARFQIGFNWIGTQLAEAGAQAFYFGGKCSDNVIDKRYGFIVTPATITPYPPIFPMNTTPVAKVTFNFQDGTLAPKDDLAPFPIPGSSRTIVPFNIADGITYDFPAYSDSAIIMTRLPKLEYPGWKFLGWGIVGRDSKPSVVPYSVTADEEITIMSYWEELP